jgi:hypothetical protein
MFPLKKSLFFIVFLLSFSRTLQAEPWIDTSDLYLKASIQLLADSGHITTPVTTYPLMWKDVIKDVKKIELGTLTTNQQQAYFYINHKFKPYNKPQIKIKTNIAAKKLRFTSFGDTFRDKNSIQLQASFINDNFAVKFAPSYTNSPNDGDDVRFDESYIAAFLGNWVISFGKQDRWFGPTWDSSFALTNNARPIPALALTRKSAKAVKIPFTEWHVPWTVTTFMAKMDDERTVKDTLLWGFRFNFKPFKNLEIGLSRLAQWGGEGRSQSLSTFWNIFIGRTNCGIDDLVCDEENPNPANQQAGYDFRYSIDWFEAPVGIYFQKFAEDGSADPGKFLTKAELQVGIDTHISVFDMPTTAYFEYSDSLADCGQRDGIGDCYYEHSSYTTGMRYNGKTISNLYDNDAETFVFGAISQINTNTRMTNKLRYLLLNYDNSDKAPDNPIIGNPLTSVPEDVIMLSTSIVHDYKNWCFTFGGDISYSSFSYAQAPDKNSDTAYNAFLTVEYNL